MRNAVVIDAQGRNGLRKAPRETCPISSEPDLSEEHRRRRQEAHERAAAAHEAAANLHEAAASLFEEHGRTNAARRERSLAKRNVEDARREHDMAAHEKPNEGLTAPSTPP